MTVPRVAHSSPTTGPTRASLMPGRCVRYHRRLLIRARSPVWTSGDANGLGEFSTSTSLPFELHG
jgi:hypothetical protein